MRMSIGLLALCLVFTACDAGKESDSETRETNVLKEFVDVPKERANSAKDRVESAQDAVKRQAEGLDSE